MALGIGRLLAMRAWLPVESCGVWVMGWILAMAILDRSHLKKFQRCMDATTAASPEFRAGEGCHCRATRGAVPLFLVARTKTGPAPESSCTCWFCIQGPLSSFAENRGRSA